MSALLDGDELVERVFHVDRGIWVHDVAPDDLCDIIRVRRSGLKGVLILDIQPCPLGCGDEERKQ